mgnify:FL=1
MPLLKLKQQMNRMCGGQTIEVETTDAGSLKDFEAFCKQAGHSMTVESDGQVHRFVIQKNAAGA